MQQSATSHPALATSRCLVCNGVLGPHPRLPGLRWRMIHLPTHLHYFSRRTLVRLLDSAGFDVVHLETAGNKRSIRGIVDAILVLRGGRQGLFDKVKSLPGLGRSITLDLRDIVYLIASPLVSSSALTPVELSSLHLDQVLGPPKVRR